jgi:hypothetical protein
VADLEIVINTSAAAGFAALDTRTFNDDLAHIRSQSVSFLSFGILTRNWALSSDFTVKNEISCTGRSDSCSKPLAWPSSLGGVV